MRLWKGFLMMFGWIKGFIDVVKSSELKKCGVNECKPSKRCPPPAPAPAPAPIDNRERR